MPITLDGTLGLGTPALSLGGTAVTASAAALNSSGEDVNSENRVINGDMNIWQRGASSAVLGYVAADRWYNSFVGGVSTQSRQAFALGDTLGMIQPTFFLRQTVSGHTIASQYAATSQAIEGVRSYAGQTITVMGWARRSSGVVGNMAVEGVQSFGAGGAGVSLPVNGINPTTVNLGATWAPFAAVMNVPTVFGKTLGTNGNDQLGLNFWTSAGSDYNARTNSLGLQTIAVDLWGIHIRTGTWTAADAALYRPRDPMTELALCQRYYQTGILNICGYGGAGTDHRYTQAWVQGMRVAPQVSFTPTLVATPALNCTTAQILATSPTGCIVRAVATALGQFSFIDRTMQIEAEIL